MVTRRRFLSALAAVPVLVALVDTVTAMFLARERIKSATRAPFSHSASFV
jgi:hypothetical protein